MRRVPTIHRSPGDPQGLALRARLPPKLNLRGELAGQAVQGLPRTLVRRSKDSRRGARLRGHWEREVDNGVRRNPSPGLMEDFTGQAVQGPPRTLVRRFKDRRRGVHHRLPWGREAKRSIRLLEET